MGKAMTSIHMHVIRDRFRGRWVCDCCGHKGTRRFFLSEVERLGRMHLKKRHGIELHGGIPLEVWYDADYQQKGVQPSRQMQESGSGSSNAI